MREGKFLEMNKQPTNFFLGKDADADRKDFNDVVRNTEELLASGRGEEVADWFRENSIELDSEKERVLAEVVAAANQVIQKYSGRNIQLAREQVATVSLDVLLEQYPETERSEHVGGVTALHIQRVMVGVGERETNSELADKVFHELMHLGSLFRVRYAAKDDDPNMGNFHAERAGLQISYRDGSGKFFRGIDEALTEMLSLRYLQSQRNNPLYKEEFDFAEEKFGDEIRGGVLCRQKNDKGEIVPMMSHSYQTEIKAATDYIEGLYKANKDRFNSADEVWEIFFHAKFTGRLLELARLIEKTGGRGEFRRLGKVSNG